MVRSMTARHRTGLLRPAPILVVLLAACGPRTEDTPPAPPAAQEQPSPPYGFADWHGDFPNAPEHPHVSPRLAGRTYDRTRRQALEQVVSNLRGSCSRDAWLFAHDLAGRLPAEEAEPLVRALDAALQGREGYDHAENILGALAAAKIPAAADAILRALESPRDALRNAAMEALPSSGTPDAVRRAAPFVDHVGSRAIKAWAEAARRYLAPAEIIDGFRRILGDARLRNVHSPVADVALMLPIEQALAVFEPFGDDVPMLVRSKLLALKQSSGEAAAEIALRQMLRSQDPEQRREAVAVLPLADVPQLLDDVLRLSVDPDPVVRLGIANVFEKLTGDDVDRALDQLATDESVEVRRVALGLLCKRNRRGVLDDLVDVVRKGTGTRMNLAIEDLVAARDPKVVGALLERMKELPPTEWRAYVHAIAMTTSKEAFVPLWQRFLGDDEWSRSNRKDLALWITNCRGAEMAMLEAFRTLPAVDWERRSLMMSTLANVAVDRETADIRGPIFAELRRVFGDRSETPQMRLHALEMLRRDLTLDDQERIRKMLRDEDVKMRAALSDFLFEFF